MRILLTGLVLAAALVSGCVHEKTAQPSTSFSALPGQESAEPHLPPAAPKKKQPLLVTPDQALVGKVVSVNETARFLVLNFPVGHLPVVDLPLNIYRKGLKVGSARVTKDQMNDYVVADLVEGNAEIGDEASNR